MKCQVAWTVPWGRFDIGGPDIFSISRVVYPNAIGAEVGDKIRVVSTNYLMGMRAFLTIDIGSGAVVVQYNRAVMEVIAVFVVADYAAGDVGSRKDSLFLGVECYVTSRSA